MDKFKVQYIVYDAHFAVVNKKSLLDALDKHEKSTYNWKAWRRYGSVRVEYRKDPVPYTGGNRWSFNHYYKTGNSCMQEKKAAEAAQQMGVRVRGKRTKTWLPDPWDDYRRADSFIKKSWKKQKKRKQWM